LQFAICNLQGIGAGLSFLKGRRRRKFQDEFEKFAVCNLQGIGAGLSLSKGRRRVKIDAKEFPICSLQGIGTGQPPTTIRQPITPVICHLLSINHQHLPFVQFICP
jgi:hypothetical protein